MVINDKLDSCRRNQKRGDTLKDGEADDEN
jgi:hypothetical protein